MHKKEIQKERRFMGVFFLFAEKVASTSFELGLRKWPLAYRRCSIVDAHRCRLPEEWDRKKGRKGKRGEEHVEKMEKGKNMQKKEQERACRALCTERLKSNHFHFFGANACWSQCPTAIPVR